MTDTSLHGHPLAMGEWWACAHPERPYDDSEMFDERCAKCVLKAQADLHNHGDRTMFDPARGRRSKYMLSDLAAGRVPAGCE